MKYKAKAKRTTGPKAAPRESIQDFMLKLSAGINSQAPTTQGEMCRSMEMGAHWATAWDATDGVTVTVGLTAKSMHDDTLLICVRDREGCHHIPMPSRAVALVLSETMTRLMRAADKERRGDED